MPKKLYFQNLAIETTRRCNMQCEHCLRDDNDGNKYRHDMPRQTLELLLSQTESIGTVTFSGGEPSLALNVIRTFYQLCDKFDVSVGSFYVVTNGMTNQLELACLFLEQYARITDPEDRDACGIALSIDMFHEAFLDDGPNMAVKGLAFYKPDKEHEDNNDLDWVISSGRAEKFCRASVQNPRELEPTTEFTLDTDGDTISVDMAYLSVNGCLYPECDLTYQRMDDCKEAGQDAEIQTIPVTENTPDLFDAILNE